MEVHRHLRLDRSIFDAIEMQLPSMSCDAHPLESNSQLFLLLEEPLTATLQDIYLLIGCFPFGESGDWFEFANHRISQTVAKYSSLEEKLPLGD